MAVASIDLGEMAALLAAMEDAAEQLPSRRGSLRGHLEDVWLSTSSLRGLDLAADWIDEQLPGVRRRLALARHIEAQTPGPQLYVQLEENDISTATPEEAEERAERAADLMDDVNGEPPQELLDLLAENGTDPYFAAALAQRVSPEDVSELVLDLSSTRRNMPMMGTMDLERIEEFDTAYESLLDGLGTTLGVATFGTGDLALEPDHAQRWLDAIIAGADTGTGTQAPGQAGALALVISRGSWSTPFLTDVTEGLYLYEQEHGVRGMWQAGSSDFSGQLFGALDPVHGDEEGAPSGWSEYYDPMAGLLDAVSRNPDAGHYLFGGGVQTDVEADGDTHSVNAFMEYLIAQRRWPTDDGAAAQAAIAAAMTPFEGAPELTADIAADAHLIITAKSEEIAARGDDANWFSTIGHLVLDGLGMVPVVGEAFDGINAVWYFAEGNVLDGSLSAAAIVPFLGWGATGGKWTRRALNADELAILARIDTWPTGFDGLPTMVARADGVPLPTFQFTDVAAFNRAANNPHPNSRYVYNGMAWETDELGRPISLSGQPSGTSPGRNPGQQRDIGHEGLDSDVGFHLLADSLGGPTNRLNVVPGNGKPLGDGLANLNQGEYASMERQLRQALRDGQDVRVDILPEYRPTNTSTRPDQFTVNAWIDGELFEFEFINK